MVQKLFWRIATAGEVGGYHDSSPPPRPPVVQNVAYIYDCVAINTGKRKAGRRHRSPSIAGLSSSAWSGVLRQANKITVKLAHLFVAILLMSMRWNVIGPTRIP